MRHTRTPRAVPENASARPRSPNGQLSQIMACPPASSTGSGIAIPAPRRSASRSSHVATAVAAASTPTNVCRMVSSGTRMIRPRPRPTAMAETRSRPARDGRRAGCSTAVGGATGAAGGAAGAGRSRAGRPGTGTSGEAVTCRDPLSALRLSPLRLSALRLSGLGCSRSGSDLEELALLVLDQVVDLVHVAVGGALELLLGPRDLVLARLAVADDAVQLVHGLTADAADRDPRVLALAAGHLDHLPAALLGELRDDHPDDLAVVAGVEPQVRVADRLLDGLELAGVVGLDDRHPRLGDVDRRQLVQRRHRAVVVDDDPREHARGGTPGADARQVVLGHRDGLLHLLLGVEERFVDHGCSLLSRCEAQARSLSPGVLTRVPILSPATARAMLPSVSRLNTMIGIRLSMQRLNAVASATARPCSSASRWVISSYILASRSILGSAV